MEIEPIPRHIRQRPPSRGHGLRWLALAVIGIWITCFFLVQRLYHPADDVPIATRTPAPVSAPLVAMLAGAQADTPAYLQGDASDRHDGHRLFKCLDARQRASFQSHPCGEGMTEVWARAYEPDRRPEPTPQLYRPPASTDHAGNASRSTPSERDLVAARCTAAQAQEAAWRNQRGLKVTHDELRAWGDATYEACHGR